MAAMVSVAATERTLRERLRDLSVLERVGGDPTRTSPSLAVKKVSRPFYWRLFVPMCKAFASLLVLLARMCLAASSLRPMQMA